MGACLWLIVPTTISRSDWRGEKRGSAAPKRSVSYGVELTAMNSMAQHAVTKGYGNSENLRAQPISSSFLVEMYSNAPVGSLRIGITLSSIALVRHAFEQPRPVYIEQDDDQQESEQEEREQHEARHRLCTERPDEQEHRFQIEQDEDDGHAVVLGRHRLDVQPVDRRRAALEGLELDRVGRGLRAEQRVEQQREADEAEDRQHVQ